MTNYSYHFFFHRIGARTVKTLEDRNVFVDGLILESPFNNLKDEMRNHPLGLVSILIINSYYKER